MIPAAPSTARRIQAALFIVAVAVVIVATLVLALLARDREDRTVERDLESAAGDAAVALADEFDAVLISLDGASAAMTADGRLAPDVFTQFALGVLDGRDVSSVALIEVTGDGAYTLRARVVPAGSSTPASDEVGPAVRAALSRPAADSGPVTAHTVDPADEDGRATALAKPLRTSPDGDPIGFVVAHVPDARTVEVVATTIGDGSRAVVSDGESVLLGEPFERREHTASAPVPVADRSLTLTVGPRSAASRALVWLVLAAGALVGVALGALVMATRRHQRHLTSENARLLREGDRARAAQVVTAQLAHAISVDEVVVVLRDLLPTTVGAASASLATFGPDGSLLIVGADEGHDPTSPTVVATTSDDSMVESVVETNDAAWLSSPLDWRGDEVVERLAQGGNALALLPLAAGAVRGVLAVSYGRIHVFDDNEREVLTTVGVLAAQALDRGRRYDTEHDAAVAFQEAALPEALPSVEGLSIAARYRPAARDAAVGGDWYDVLSLDNGRTMLVVGDVVGHGMEAAAAMARIRTALQVIASLDADPGVILRTMSGQIDAIPNAFCTTVLCVVIDPDARTLTWSRAGHPPPLLISGARTELLDDQGGPPLGVVDDVTPPVHRRRLEPGDRLVLYTDGMIERRGESIDEGFDRLASVCRSLADLDEAEFADVLVEALMPHDDQSDDIAILVVALATAAPDVERRPVEAGATSAPATPAL